MPKLFLIWPVGPCSCWFHVLFILFGFDISCQAPSCMDTLLALLYFCTHSAPDTVAPCPCLDSDTLHWATMALNHPGSDIYLTWLHLMSCAQNCFRREGSGKDIQMKERKEYKGKDRELRRKKTKGKEEVGKVGKEKTGKEGKETGRHRGKDKGGKRRAGVNIIS